MFRVKVGCAGPCDRGCLVFNTAGCAGRPGNNTRGSVETCSSSNIVAGVCIGCGDLGIFDGGGGGLLPGRSGSNWDTVRMLALLRTSDNCLTRLSSMEAARC